MPRQACAAIVFKLLSAVWRGSAPVQKINYLELQPAKSLKNKQEFESDKTMQRGVFQTMMG